MKGWVGILLVALAGHGMAQTAGETDWQAAAGGERTFEVASVRQDLSGAVKPASFSLSAEDGAGPTDGLFHADLPLTMYIEFAYKLLVTGAAQEAMYEHAPAWVKTDRYSIEARVEGAGVTKDQARLMVRALLAERFGLKVHVETRVLPVLALRLVEPGKLGPRIHPHAEGPPCDAPEPAGAIAAGKIYLRFYPFTCGVTNLQNRPEHRMLLGARGNSLALTAASLGLFPWVGKTVVDQTGQPGRFDYTVEWTDEPVADGELAGSGFFRAMREQLGMKLEVTRAPVQVLVVDSVQRPSEN